MKVIVILTSLLLVCATAFAQSIVYSSDTFAESAGDDGSIDNTTPITVTLTGETFVISTGSFTSGVEFAVTGLPAGFTALSVTVTSSTTADLEISGNATNHTNDFDISVLEVAFNNAAFTGGDASAVTGSTKSDLAIDFSGTATVTYSSSTFSEAGANDGSIDNSTPITITLSGGDSYTAGPFDDGDEYTVSNVPDGLTLDVTRTSSTVLSLELSGNATNHTNDFDVSDLTIVLNDAAFAGGNAGSITGVTKNDLVIDFSGTATVTYSSSTFSEAGANDGSIDNSTPITITLSGGDSYTAGPFDDGDEYTVSNVPDGLTLDVTRTSSTVLSLELSGNATNHTNDFDVSDLTIVLNDAAFAGGNAGSITGVTKNDLVIDFSGTATVTYSSSTFSEAGANDGSIDNSTPITITLSGGDSYTAGPFDDGDEYTVSNVPDGLTLDVTRTSSTVLSLELSGNATNHTNDFDVSDLTIVLNDAAFAGGNAGSITGVTKNDLVIDFSGTATVTYSSSTFSEAGANDGSIDNSTPITITLSGGDSYTAGPFDDGDEYTVSNVPDGLTLDVTRTSSTVLSLELSGNATNHTNDFDVSDLTIVLNDAAFAGGNAGSITGVTKNDLVIDFSGTATVTYSSSTFSEAGANDGSIDNSTPITITLSGGDSYTAGPFDDGDEYTVSNVPDGLTLDVTRTSSTVLSLELSGNATNHTNDFDVSDLTIVLNDAAFAGGNAGSITGVTKNDLVIDFSGTATVTYSSSTFSEAGANDGSIDNSTPITITLSGGDSYTAGPFDDGDEYTVSNVPDGLTLDVTRTSSTVLSLELSGNATNHTNDFDVSDLTIVLNDAAFAGGNAGSITGVTKNDLVIDFSGTATVTYSSSTFSEAGANDGSIDNSTPITITLSGGDSYTAGPFDDGDEYTVSNVPDGLTLDVTRTSSTVLSLELSGNATNHTNDFDVSDLTIVLNDAAFAGGNAGSITGVTKNDLVIDFSGTATVTYSSSTFSEAGANDGSIDNTTPITITLSGGDSFTSGSFGEEYVVTNLPEGLDLLITQNSSTELSIVISGSALRHTNAFDVEDLTLEFTDVAFQGGNSSSVVNSTKTDLVIDFSGIATLTYSGSIFLEDAANDGSINNGTPIEITLEGSETFAEVLFNEGEEYSINNLPSGLTENISRISNTELSITFLGNAINHSELHDIDNLTISFSDDAFLGGSVADVNNSSRTDLVIDFSGNATLSYSSGTFTEDVMNDGTIGTSITLTLEDGETFVNSTGELTQGTHYTISNLPDNFELPTIAVASDSLTATVSISNQAINHTNDHDVDDLAITFLDAAFTGGNAGVVTNFTRSDLIIDFSGNATLSYSSGTFTEDVMNDGSIGTSITLTLEDGETFVNSTGELTQGTHYTISNLPDNLELPTIAVASDSLTATVSISNQAINHTNDHDVDDLTITFLDAAFTGGNAGVVTNFTRSDLIIDFSGNATLSYSSGTFTEDVMNDGSIGTSITLTLEDGETFVNSTGELTQGTHYTISNLPDNLELPTIAVASDSLTATVSISNQAINHTNDHDVDDLAITFLDAAFTGGNAGVVTNFTRSDLIIDFSGNATLSYSSGTFTEDVMNDGSIGTSITLTLEDGETFVNSTGELTQGTHYTISNLPDNLELPTIAVASDSLTATVSISNQAINHTNDHDVDDLTITFLDAAFTGGNAGVVTNFTRSDLIIDFSGNATLSYSSGTFTEDVMNDGSIGTSITLTLEDGETFVNSTGELTQGTHYTISNFPDNLELPTIAVASDSLTATVSISNQAINHTNDHDVDDLTITFLDAAFTGGNAGVVTNFTRSDLIIDFSGNATLSYSSGTFTEDVMNDGSIGTSITLTLEDGETFVNSTSELTQGTHYTISNLPDNLELPTIAVASDSLTATVSISNQAINHTNDHDVDDLTITFLDAAFTGGNAGVVTNFTRSDLIIDFSGNATLIHDEFIFRESEDNDGTMSNIIEATLMGGETFIYNSGVLQLNTHYLIENLPLGLSVPTIEVSDDSLSIVIRIQGQATYHDDALNTEITLSLLDNAFSGNSSNAVEGSSSQFSLVFNADKVITSISPLIVVCADEEVSISVITSQTNLQYQWQILSSGTESFTSLIDSDLYSGSSTESLSLSSTPLNLDESLFRCIVSGEFGNEISDTVLLKVNPGPEVNGGVNQLICAGSEVILKGQGSNASYSWESSGEGNFNDTSTPMTTYAPSLDDFQLGTVTITLIARGINEGCLDQTQLSTWNVEFLKSPDIQVVGDDVICQNQKNTTYSVPNGGLESSFDWFITSGKIVQDNGRSVRINWEDNSDAYQIKAFETNTLGCMDSTIFQVSLKNDISPDTTKISLYASRILAAEDSNVDTYQWGYTELITGKEVVIEGATEQIYIQDDLDLDQKQYWVETAFEGGCKTRSVFEFDVLTSISNFIENQVSIFPNPTNDKINLQISALVGRELQIKILDVRGQMIQNEILKPGSFIIDLPQPKGIYFVEIYTENIRISSTKIIKK